MNLLDKNPYIVIEGPIGAGKTSLSRRIAQYLDTDLLLEQAEENPFLTRFYREPKRYALATQLFFLFQRSTQLAEIRQNDLFRRALVADFLLDKDPLFAELNLEGDEFRLYQTVYQQLHPQTAKPDLVIYLQARPGILLERIRKRGITCEQSISIDYLTRLTERYTHYFHHYEDTPLLIVNCEQLDFVNDDVHFERLIQHIRNMRGAREFFNQSI